MTNLIDPLPTAPSRVDPPATFVTKANAFVAALPTFVTQVNAFIFALAQQTAADLVTLLGYSPTPDSFRNRLLNGNFDLWQRATSQTTTGYKSADRWKVDSITSVTVAQGASTTFGKSSLTITPSNATNAVVLAQTLEDFRLVDLKGGNATFSIYASCPSNASVTISIQKSATANDSTGGGGGWTTINSFVCAVTGAAARFKVTSAIPTDGTANGLRAVISTSNTNNGVAIKIWAADLSPGSNPPPVEIRPVDLELSLCQRHYFDTNPGSSTAAYNVTLVSGGTGATYSATMAFPTVMYAAPTLTFRNTTFFSVTNGTIGASATTKSSTQVGVASCSGAGTGSISFNVIGEAEF